MLELDLQRFSELDGGVAQEGDAPQETGMEPTDAGQENGGETFEELIKGRYKQDYQNHVRDAISRRFRNQEDLQAQLDARMPIMQALAMKYGKDPDDVEGIAKLLTDDDSLYAEEANRMGLPVATVKQMKKLEAENARQARELQESAEERSLRQHFQRISDQAEELKATFPDFDLMEEIRNNARFARMTSPDIGMSVKDAYYACHGDEIVKASAQAAAQQAGQRLAASVQAGSKRPVENGVRGGAPAQIGLDIKHMSKETRAEIRKRVHGGESGINFRDHY